MNNTAKKVSQNSTISRSGLDYRGAHTSGNMNRSNNPIIGNTGGATALNALNSNINDCKFENSKLFIIAELEIEFGYCTEEESIF